MPIRHYLAHNSAFGPEVIRAMSEALEQSCAALNINGDARQREIIATRIIDLARGGITEAKALSERVVSDARAMRSV